LDPWPAAPAAAQCYSGYPNYLSGSNICGTHATDGGSVYEIYTSTHSFFVSVPGDREYLIATMSNDLGVYDVTNPLSPLALGGTIHIPWDWSTINVGGSTHERYIAHLRTIATLGGFKYGVAMLADYGWDFFKLNGNQSGFLGHGYHPQSSLQNSSYYGAALFQIGNNIYAAAQALDRTSDNGLDPSIKIYKVGVVGNPSLISLVIAGVDCANVPDNACSDEANVSKSPAWSARTAPSISAMMQAGGR